jgi:hypothetical protein
VAAFRAGGALWIAQLTSKSETGRHGVTKARYVMAQADMVLDVGVEREGLWQLKPRLITEAKRTPPAVGQQWELSVG